VGTFSIDWRFCCWFGSITCAISSLPPPLREGMLHRELTTIFDEKSNPHQLYCSYKNGPVGGLFLPTDPGSNTAVSSRGSILVRRDKDGNFSLFQRASNEVMWKTTITPTGISNSQILYNHGSYNLNVLKVDNGAMLEDRSVIAFLQACNERGKTH
jgi:hypothetical protein